MFKINESILPKSYSPKVSCFWIINGKFYGNKLALNQAYVNGDYVISNKTHYALWFALQNKYHSLKNKDYKYFPRGRVKYNIKIQQAEVLCDEKIINNQNIKDKIMKKLGLLPTTIFKIDEQYKSQVDVFLK